MKFGKTRYIHKKAHEKEVASLSICVCPNIANVELCLISCSSDRTVKLWVANVKKSKNHMIKLECLNTIQTTDDVLFSKFSPNGKYIIFALADNTIKVLFADSFKISLSLYGHKLPASTFDVSSDTVLLASGGSDKNVRIWGLDFGDCHKSMFLFEDTITNIKFVKDTHFFFACSKDGYVKYVDGDRFETICAITKHFAEVWSIEVSSIGDELFSVSSDKTIQVWRQSDEPILANDNKEQIENEMVNDADQLLGEYYDPFDHNQEKSSIPFKATKEKLDASSDLVEAIIKAEEFKVLIEQYQISLEINKRAEKPKIPNEFKECTLHEYIYQKLKRIASADVENVLRFVPPTYQLKLIWYLSFILDSDFDLSLKCLVYIYNECYNQIVSTPSIASMTNSLYDRAMGKLKTMKSIIGCNVVATSMILKSRNNGKLEDFQERSPLS